jgi:phospholipase/carboxylesterase
MEHIHLWKKGTSERTFLFLHGTGGTEHDLISLGETFDPSASVLSVRGRSTEEGMNRFFRRLAEGIFDEADLIEKTNELADFILLSATQYGFDPLKVIAVGYSNGANIAAAMLLLRPEVLGGAILLRAMVPLEPKEKVDLSDKRILLLSGVSDPILPLSNAKRLAQMFEERGNKVQHEILPTGHNLTRADVEIAAAWL